MRGCCSPPARFILSQGYASAGLQMYPGEQLRTKKHLPFATKSSSMLVLATPEHATVGGRALQPGVATRESTARSLKFRVLAGQLPPVVSGYPKSGSLCRDTAASLLGKTRHSDTQKRLRKRTSAGNFVRKSVCRLYQPVVDVGMGYSRAHDCWRARSPARRRFSRK